MDQYGIDISFSIPYPDLLEMIYLLSTSDNEVLKTYAEVLEEQCENQIEANKASQ